MTVAELIKILQELPQDKKVYDYEGAEIEDVVEDDSGVFIEQQEGRQWQKSVISACTTRLIAGVAGLNAESMNFAETAQPNAQKHPRRVSPLLMGGLAMTEDKTLSVTECKDTLETAMRVSSVRIPKQMIESTLYYLKEYERLKSLQGWSDSPEAMGR